MAPRRYNRQVRGRGGYRGSTGTSTSTSTGANPNYIPGSTTRITVRENPSDDAGSQGGLSFNQLNNALTNASKPKSEGGWIDDQLYALMRPSPSTNPGGAPRPTPPGGGGPGGGGRGRGGGMAGGVSDEAKRASLIAGLQSLIGSGAFQAKSIDPDLERIRGAVSADQATANSQYDSYDQYLAKMANDYQGREVRKTTQVTPELLALLGSQGVDTGAYQGQVGLANTMAAQGDDAAQRLNDDMAEVVRQANEARGAEAKLARQFATESIGATQNGMEAYLQKQFRDEQRGLDNQRTQVIMQLIQAMAEGGQNIDLSQFFPTK